jgi:hypothetical protein
MFEFFVLDALVIGGGAFITLVSATVLPPSSRRWWLSVVICALAFASGAAGAYVLFERNSDPALIAVVGLSIACTVSCGVTAFLARRRSAASRLIWAAIVVAPFVLVTPSALFMANGGL